MAAAAAAHPIKLAIIGSGPSAFYAATRALTSAPTPAAAPISAVRIYKALPTPFGLVRAGVAPDHPDVKNVSHRFTEVVRSVPALGSRYRGAGQAGEGEGAAGVGLPWARAARTNERGYVGQIRWSVTEPVPSSSDSSAEASPSPAPTSPSWTPIWEAIDTFFGNVCELDLVFNFYKVYAILDEVFLGGEIEETSKTVVLSRLEQLEKLE
ncbi:hypothetical protein CF336_g1333 [Tilletia laevis]|nr:hypothetical protein CF336_g1333 [Tilletia laevis]